MNTKEYNKKVNGAIRRILNSADGEILMKHLDETYFNQISFNENPHVTSFREGQRDVIFDLKQRKNDGR